MLSNGVMRVEAKDRVGKSMGGGQYQGGTNHGYVLKRISCASSAVPSCGLGTVEACVLIGVKEAIEWEL